MVGVAELDLDSLPVPAPWGDASAVRERLHAAMASQQNRERWKYTKQANVLALFSSLGENDTAVNLSDAHAPFQPGEVTLESLGTDLTRLLHDAPEALLSLCLAPTQVLHVAANSELKLDLSHTTATLPSVIYVGKHARLQLNETYTTDNSLRQCLWIIAEPASRIEHARNLTGTPDEASGSQWQFLSVALAQDSHYTLHNHSCGMTLNRQDVQIHCLGTGAHAELCSSAAIAPGAHLDQQVTLQHHAAHSTSNQTVHNIVGHKANVTFNGRIHIHPHAPGVSAHLSNKNICLSEATVNTKPELEIYTDDVKCSHGATIGRLDDMHAFYCQSRGIAPALAKQLLSKAFLNTATKGAMADAALQRYSQVLSL